MKNFKLLLMLSLCAILASSCGASKVTSTLDDTENPTAVLTLKNGQTVEGIAKNYLRADPTYIELETRQGKKVEYPSSEVKSLVFKAKTADGKDELWLPLTVEQTNLLKKTLSAKPMFVRVTYDGTNVMALERPVRSTNPHAPNAIGVMTQQKGWGTQFFYLLKGDTIAKQYWYHDNISTATHVGAKSMLKKSFKDYPQVVRGIDDGRLNYKQDLTEFIRVMDMEWGEK